jgi:hypothetical protein
MVRQLWQLTLVFSVAFGAACTALAFGGSEQERWKAEVIEAKARANDFRKHLTRTQNADRERESSAAEASRQRDRIEAEEEKARLEYVKARDAKADPAEIEAKLEKKYERIRGLDEREMEEARLAYVRIRDRVREVLKRDAYIDEKLEYGLKYDASTRAKPKARR